LAPLEKHGKASISVPEGVASPLQKVRFCPPSPDKRATKKSWRGYFHDMMGYVGGDIMGISVEIHGIYSIVCPMGISTLFFFLGMSYRPRDGSRQLSSYSCYSSNAVPCLVHKCVWSIKCAMEFAGSLPL
jgi:hypothetical protein